MVKEIENNINAKGIGIRIISSDSEDDYICLTDLAKYKNSDEPRFIIQNWLRTRNTLENIICHTFSHCLGVKSLTVCNSIRLDKSQGLIVLQ